MRVRVCLFVCVRVSVLGDQRAYNIITERDNCDESSDIDCMYAHTGVDRRQTNREREREGGEGAIVKMDLSITLYN